MAPTDELIRQLEVLLSEFEAMRARCKFDDLSDLNDTDCFRFVTRARAGITRAAGPGTPYFAQCESLIEMKGQCFFTARRVAGVLASLRDDLAAGFTVGLREIIHGEMFADYLSMARHLLGGGYKDAAAVIAGSSLEVHLRNLAIRHGIAVETTKDGRSSPKRADTLNAELAAAGAYEKLDHKSVTAWLDLRNKAAHGRYSEYQSAQVALLIDGIREFMARLPA